MLLSPFRGITTRLYALISEQDWDSIPSLYHPRALLTRANRREAAVPQFFSVTEYIEQTRPLLRDGTFVEHEVEHQFFRFGDVAHVISVFEAKHQTKARLKTWRGVNLIQLVRDPGWLIISIAWDTERAGRNVPSEIALGGNLA